MSISSLNPFIIAADCDLPKVETVTIANPAPRIPPEHLMEREFGKRSGKNGAGPMKRNPRVNKIFPRIETTTGCWILSQIWKRKIVFFSFSFDST